ncbi:MAG: M13 family metallopeptidase, partial [Bacteroidetes bacterium]|nr:M13 family metallopeptidase [Bacteroidota bacterium]
MTIQCRGLLFTASLLVVGACASTTDQRTTDNPQADTAAVTTTSSTTTGSEGVGINLAYMDTTVSPGEDFFRYVNGRWIDQTEIPGDQGRWGSFQELRELNNATLLTVLQQAAESDQYAAGSDERKAAAFYRIGMDSLRAEQQGLAPLKKQLDKIQAIKTKEELQAFLVQDDKQGLGSFWGLWVGPDSQNSSQYLVNLYAGGIGLPERDYYLNQDAKSVEVREKYVAFVGQMLQKAGISNPTQKAQTIMAIETDLAKSMLSKEERRNPYKTYNKMSVAQLQKLTPAVKWETYFNGIGTIGLDSVNVMQTAYMEQLDKIMKDRSLEDLKAYITWKQVADAAPYLNNEFVQTSFDFYSKYLRGIDENSPRWKRV